MNKPKRKRVRIYSSVIFGITDIVFTFLSFLIAFYIKDVVSPLDLEFNREYIILSIVIVLIWTALLKLSNLTNIPRTRTIKDIFFNLIKSTIFGIILLHLIVFMFRFNTFRPIIIIIFGLVNLFFLFFTRIVAYKILRTYRASGHDLNNVIIYADDSSLELIKKIQEHKEWGFRILMVLTNSEKIRTVFQGKIKIFPEISDIRKLIQYDIVDEVIYCKSSFDMDDILKLVKTCNEIGVSFRLQSMLSPASFSKTQVTHIQNYNFITYRNTPTNALGLAWKSVFEFFISFFMVLILSPLLLLIAVLIKTDSKGPAIFKQERVGLRGRKFYIYKFRTMIQNAEELKARMEKLNESDGPTFKIKNDPRITRVGKILRKTSLDELPQLFNVLKGEMAIVGPRPPIPSEVSEYERWQLRRLSVKPGLTCTWQIIPNRNDVLFEKWMKLDIQYIENWSLRKDIALFFKTLKTVIGGGGA